ncbi:MAG: histone deacetylase [Methanobacteriales archaeon]|nr:histone deacetylase [Methanobacteriaceae archaeon]MBC7097327.1 histone deacetylase [Methanobacteriales archaeon]
MTIIYSPSYDLHNMELHVENKKRTDAIMESLSVLDPKIVEPKMASPTDILKVHTQSHLDYVKGFAERGGGYLDYDTYMTSESYNVALLAAGGAITASEIVSEDGGWAYSVARPPGHHATRDRAMGFCIFNNMAIAIEHLREKGLDHFLIIDFDVHYGNGTADIFYDDPNVMYISIHQDPRTLYPGTGFIDEMGAGDGMGYTMNIPMPPGSNTSDYIWILSRILEPVKDEFKPSMVFLEAGFDAHKDDPLANMMIDEEFYTWMGSYMSNERVVAVLEGGYNLKALANSNLKFVKSLMGLENPIEDEIRASDFVKGIFERIRSKFPEYFKI